MKREPITRKDQAHLIHLIAREGEFAGQRGGARVTLKIHEALWGRSIVYRAAINGRVYTGETPTVAAAVDELNQVIRHGGMRP